MLFLGMVLTNLYMLFYAGDKRMRFARADKAVALQYNYQWSTDTNICTVFTPGVIVGRWTQAQPGKNALL